MILERLELIDTVVSLRLASGEIECRSAIPLRSSIFDGHFPHHPIMPGVFMIEAMAQAAGFLFLAGKRAAQMPFLIGVDRARFRGFASPGDILAIAAALRHESSGFSVFGGSVRRGDQLLAETEIRLAARDFPNEGMRRHLLERLAAIGAAPAPDQPAPREAIA